MADYDYDLFTIGAGSGGVRASRLAAETGARVGVAEEYRVGGTCVIRGCVPKKLFVFASEFASTFRDAEGFGWSKTGGEFDWSRLVADKDAEIDRLNDIYIANLKKAGVEIINSRATLRDPHTIYLENEGRTVTAKTILIATGAAPRVDTTIAGHEIAVSSNELFHLEELPKRIVIYGGGYIAVEFAGIFHALGVKTTLVYRGQQILRGFDNDMRHWLSLELVRQGINLVTETTLTDIEKIGRDHVVSLSSGRSLTTDLVVFAIGRDPNTQGLGLETAGVEVGRNGRIEVDAHSKTSADNIYAVGDVTDRVALTPVAIKEGAAFVETVFKDNPTTVDHDLIASAVFSQPQIGTVGLTEAEARERFSSVDIYKTDFRPMKNVLAGNDARMVMKMVVDGETDRVLGIHILGPDAAEMVQGLAVALRLGATKADFDATMPLHPSSAEELMTMRTKWEPPKIDREAEARRAVS